MLALHVNSYRYVFNDSAISMMFVCIKQKKYIYIQIAYVLIVVQKIHMFVI